MTALPEFESPPLDEVILTVAFEPVGLRVPHFGFYWGDIRKDYPKFNVLPPINADMEEGLRGGNVRIEFSSDADAVRCWFMDESETRLIQLQRDRFVTNWRRVAGDEVYPRWRTEIKERFSREWSRTLRFFEEQGIGTPSLRSLEISYVNKIPADENWSLLRNPERLFPFWKEEGKHNFLPSPERISFVIQYVIPMEQGHLTVMAAPVIDTKSGNSAIQFRLTASIKGSQVRSQDMMGWFELGHEWIVRGFTDLTSDEMHKIWKRKV